MNHLAEDVIVYFELMVFDGCTFIRDEDWVMKEIEIMVWDLEDHYTPDEKREIMTTAREMLATRTDLSTEYREDLEGFAEGKFLISR